MNYYNDYYFRGPASNMLPPMPLQANPYQIPDNLKTSVRLIRESLSGEKEDEVFYDFLITEAPTEEDKEIIRSIRNDERKHYVILKELYFELTGRIPPTPAEPEFEKPDTYIEGIQKALFGELSAVERYRKVLFGLAKRTHINMITEILTDELKHADKYNFLYSKNKI